MIAKRRHCRRGTTLLELTVSVVLLSAAMSVAVKVLGWVAHDRRAAERRLWAVQSASNLMERVAAEPFRRVTAERVSSIASGLGAEAVLPNAAWKVAVDDDRGAPVPSRRVSVQLHWDDRPGRPGAPVRLTAWVSGGGGAR